MKDTKLSDFFKSLPKFYMASSLLRVAKIMYECREQKRVCHFAMGSHVIKNGVSPYIVDWMKKGMITTVSFNSSAIVHDYEIGFFGSTSEDVDASIDDGHFGVVRETTEGLSKAIKEGAEKKRGLGASIGEAIRKKGPHWEQSLLATAFELKIPSTVHLSVGTDILHIHPSFDVALAAQASYEDFLIFCDSVSKLEKGLYVNVGSAVILPEVFLKALSLVRNLGHEVNIFTTANFDFIRQYRTKRNVLERPTQKGGEGIEIIGPHEIMIPLLHAATMVIDGQEV